MATSVHISGMAAGGEGVGRLPEGKAVFVGGVVPGEEVEVEVVDDRKRFARARLVAVRTASPDRRPPPCPHVAAGCGGCDWQHLDELAQRRWKRQVVVDSLTRLGGLTDPTVATHAVEPVWGYRTTLRMAVDDDGRLAWRSTRSNDLVAVDSCPIAHPTLDAEIGRRAVPGEADGGDGDGDEVVLRVGSGTGDVVIGDEAGWLYEEVAGRRLRVSTGAFFQASPQAAEALVVAVGDALGPLHPGTRLTDLYGGGGLFAATVGRDCRVTLVESNRAACADARVNLAGLDAKVIAARVERWTPGPADVVIADPARPGLKAPGVAAIDRTGARRLALVSCDAASLGRDTKLLTETGWSFRGATLVDCFPQTSHVEVVTTFTR